MEDNTKPTLHNIVSYPSYHRTAQKQCFTAIWQSKTQSKNLTNRLNFKQRRQQYSPRSEFFTRARPSFRITRFRTSASNRQFHDLMDASRDTLKDWFFVGNALAFVGGLQRVGRAFGGGDVRRAAYVVWAPEIFVLYH